MPTESTREIIDSWQLRAFAAVARHGSFTLGAREIFVTQPAASHAIKLLEDELGCRLFDRIGKRALLTLAGEQLLNHCDQIFRTMHEARSNLRTLRTWGQTRLRLGATGTACQHIVPTVLREFQRRYPDCMLRVESGDTPQLIDQLVSNQIDLALMIEPERQPDITFTPLFTDELQFVTEPSHPWVGASSISPSEIAKATLIHANKTTRTFRLIETHFKAERIPTARRSIELGNIDSIKELVKKGLGVGIMAAWTIERELACGELTALPIGPKPLQRTWGIGCLRGRRLTLAEETCITLCREAAPALGLSHGKPKSSPFPRPSRVSSGAMERPGLNLQLAVAGA